MPSTPPSEVSALVSALVGASVSVLVAVGSFWLKTAQDRKHAKRKDRLELLNRRLADFYGPLHVACEAGKRAHAALVERIGQIPEQGLHSLTDPQLREWRTWLIEVFLPLNERREKLIIEKAYLTGHPNLPEPLLAFLHHAASVRVMARGFEEDPTKQPVMQIPYPQAIDTWAASEYGRLLRKQEQLIAFSEPALR